MSTYMVTLATVFVVAFAIIVWHMISDVLKDFADDPIFNGAVITVIICVVLWLLSIIPFERIIT